MSPPNMLQRLGQDAKETLSLTQLAIRLIWQVSPYLLLGKPGFTGSASYLDAATTFFVSHGH